MKKGVLRKFTKLTCTWHLYQSLILIKFWGPQACNFFDKRLRHKCFLVNFVKFLGTPFLQNTSGRLFLTSRSSHLQMLFKIGVLKALLKKLAGWRQATLLIKRLQQRCFPVKFAQILRTYFLQNASVLPIQWLHLHFFEKVIKQLFRRLVMTY